MLPFAAPPSHSAYDSQDALVALQDLEVEIRHRRNASNQVSPTSSSQDIDTSELRDLTDQAVWMVSTAKAGNGVEQLLDGNPETFWQSDGPQPHTISAQFVSKVAISEVLVYLNYEKDESYTPAVLSVRVGSNFHDLRLVRRLRRQRNPSGWVRIPLGDSPDILDDDSENDLVDDSSDQESPSADDLPPSEAAYRAMWRAARRLRREEAKTERHKALDELQRRAESGVNGEFELLRDRSITKAHMIQIVIHSNHQNGRDSHVRMVRVLGPKRQIASRAPRFTSKEFQMYGPVR